MSWAILLAVFSANAFETKARLPDFESFSYLKDPLFSNRAACATPSAEPMDWGSPPVIMPVARGNECPDIAQDNALSDSERFTLQLALDRALSQILKLTVDYEALRSRVQRFDSTTSGQEDFNRTEASEFEEIMKLNAKRLADLEKQISVLKIQLESAQSRYDSENVARLLADKQLKILQSKNKKAKQTSLADSDKTYQLARQLEANQKLIRKLKIDLTAEKLINVRLITEQKQAVAKPMPAEPAPAEPVPAEQMAKSTSAFTPSREWVIEGLKFKPALADIEPGSVQNLGVLVEYLKQNTSLNVQVNGYTDSIGSAASNLHLSQARANAVADYLIKQGVAFHRIKALGYGERRPLGDNELEQGRLLNRRVAVLFLE